MKSSHIALALVAAAIWGFNFVVIRVGLGTIPPLLLAALRFVVAAVAVFFLPRPDISWPRMIVVGLALFVGQFAFLFTGMAHGMPAGLASIAMQSQAFFTVLIAAVILKDRPGVRQITGICLAFLGLGIIASTIGGDVTLVGLGLTLAAAASWAAGNILLRGLGKVDMLAMISWLCLVPPLPLFLLSLALEGPRAIGTALAGMTWLGAGAVLYIAVLSTIVAFGIWGHLLKIYPAAVVAPFSLLVPIFGTLSAALLLGEQFGPRRIAGMALILVGLSSVALPAGWLRLPGRRAVAGE